MQSRSAGPRAFGPHSAPPTPMHPTQPAITATTPTCTGLSSPQKCSAVLPLLLVPRPVPDLATPHPFPKETGTHTRSPTCSATHGTLEASTHSTRVSCAHAWGPPCASTSVSVCAKDGHRVRGCACLHMGRCAQRGTGREHGGTHPHVHRVSWPCTCAAPRPHHAKWAAPELPSAATPRAHAHLLDRLILQVRLFFFLTRLFKHAF